MHGFRRGASEPSEARSRALDADVRAALQCSWIAWHRDRDTDASRSAGRGEHRKGANDLHAQAGGGACAFIVMVHAFDCETAHTGVD